MLNLTFECAHQLTVLRENGQVEVVVVVCDEDFARCVDANPNGVVGDTLPADLTQVDAFVTEDFDAMRAVVADKDFLFVVDHNAVGELEVFGTPEFL